MNSWITWGALLLIGVFVLHRKGYLKGFSPSGDRSLKGPCDCQSGDLDAEKLAVMLAKAARKEAEQSIAEETARAAKSALKEKFTRPFSEKGAGESEAT